MSSFDSKQTFDVMSESSQSDDEPVQQNEIDTPTPAKITVYSKNIDIKKKK